MWSWYLRSELTEDALGSNISGALPVSITDVSLEAFVVAGCERSRVNLEHSDSGKSSVAYWIFATHGSRGHRSMRKRSLQGVQKVYHDVDKLWKVTHYKRFQALACYGKRVVCCYDVWIKDKKDKGRMGGIPLQPALPWRRLGRDLLHRAPSTVPQPIYPEASEKQHRLRNQTLLFTFLS